MTIQQQIEECLDTAKAYAITSGLELITLESYGESECCDISELNLFVEWISILEDYYQKRYLGVAYPGWQYLSEPQALLLMARINSKDFKQQSTITVSVSGAFDGSFDDSFDVGG